MKEVVVVTQLRHSLVKNMPYRDTQLSILSMGEFDGGLGNLKSRHMALLPR